MSTDAPDSGSSSDESMIRRINDLVSAVTDRMARERRPQATYRVQLNSQCPFRAIVDHVPYWKALGISDLYVSPFLQSRPGSVHGYDIINPAAINLEIGTFEELQALRTALREYGMGLIADVVPNHMAAVPQLNAWWSDVLENGPASMYAGYFDIDWRPLKHDLIDKVLLPVLDDQYGQVLENGRLVVRYDDGAFSLVFFESRFPIAPDTYALILTPRVEELQGRLGADHPDLLEFFSILTAIKHLPARTETDLGRLVERRREKEVIKRRLSDLIQRSPEVAEFIEENLRQINGVIGDPRSFDRLDELLQNQAYRLAYWRVAADEINYRRFFDVNDLAAVCTEVPAVLADTHQRVFGLLDDGTITGVRIDHPDGLYDPLGYLSQLQEMHFLRLCHEAATELGGTEVPTDRLRELWRAASQLPGSPLARPLYLVVEKILARGESLPENWPIHGTVGYEFLNAVNGLFVDPKGQQPLSTLYERFTGEPLDFAELAYQCKRLIVRISLSAELNVLGDRLDRISERDRQTRDFTRRSLKQALQEVMACFGVYRTYVQHDQLLERDSLYIMQAVARAKRRNPAMSGQIFDFIRDVLLLRHGERLSDDDRQALRKFVGKFQQLTGPVMAKAIEDTAFYRFNRLISLNEVGGEPAEFGTSVAEFHRFQQTRLPRLSHTLNASSTHDTKRSEDVRARINVLSEIPKLWREHVQAWGRVHRRLTTEVDGVVAPSRNTEYLFYQTLVGLWPDSIPQGADREALVARLQQYLLKVEREAKVHTSWISPNEAYEMALTQFVTEVFAVDRRRSILTDLHEFASRVADHGWWNSLSQVLLKIASPGVPDFYQGTETWNLTLVDPDNRRPVNSAALRQVFENLCSDLSATMPGTTPSDVIDRWLDGDRVDAHRFLDRLIQNRADGCIKLFVTMLGLHTRSRFPDLFTAGEYLPLETMGTFADCVIAFARRHEDRWAIVVVPRLTVTVCGFGGSPPMGDHWRDTAITLPAAFAASEVRELFTQRAWAGGAVFPLSVALQGFPVSLWFARGT
jgi:(1->4)-alpha-D-glucan 1-alpha-D-glucosylmutase